MSAAERVPLYARGREAPVHRPKPPGHALLNYLFGLTVLSGSFIAAYTYLGNSVAEAHGGTTDIADVLAIPHTTEQIINPQFALQITKLSKPVQFWGPKIETWSDKFGLDPALAATVMQIESCGLPNAGSKAGAQGLFQVMPFHFAPGEDMLDPDINADRGLEYLALGLQRANGNVGLALAGYNGGHGMIGRDSSLWPAETQRYWYWGTRIYEEISAGQESDTLQEWLSAGGQSLCNRASEALKLS